MLKLLFLFCLLKLSNAQSYKYALDVSERTTDYQFSCMHHSRYSMLFAQIYNTDDKINDNGIGVMMRAQEHKMQTFGYISPDSEGDNADSVVDQVDAKLKFFGINTTILYVQVSHSTGGWISDTATNTQFINDLITRITFHGYQVGIYTSHSDWLSLTENAQTLARPVAGLAYSNVYSRGVTGESQPNYDDFVAFGPFKKSDVRMKQFAREEGVCEQNVNRIVYV